MTEEQKAAGMWLTGYLKHKYNVTKTQKHSDVNATACPGKNFLYAEISSATYVEDINDIEIQVHCQTYGWQKEALAGETAGTTGEAKRLEAIEIVSA